MLRIREATTNDCESINEIYNHYVITSTATFQIKEETLVERESWLRSHSPSVKFPVLVCEEVIGASPGVTRVVGWGSISKFKEREAYQFSCEDSIYVSHDHTHKGIGSMLLKELISRAKIAGFHSIIAGIEASQSPSLSLHSKFGFQQVARLKEIGQKFDKWLDVCYLQLML